MKLSKFIRRFIFIIAFVSSLLTFLISMIFQYKNFENDIIHIKEEYTELKKQEIEEEVLTIFKLIEYKEEVLNKSLNSKSKEEIEKQRAINQNELLEWIASLRFENSGYVFVNSTDGKALVFDGKKIENSVDYPYPHIFQKVINTVDNSAKEGFFTYKFKKLDTSEEFDKISFVKKYEKYNWIIGCGVYLDEVEMELKKKELDFQKNINMQLTTMFLVFIFILAVIYFISSKISKYIDLNIANLILSFKKASRNNEKINTSDLTFKEFVILANNINMTLENKNRIEKRLQDYIKIVDENVIISSTNKDGIITDVSESFCEISGYSREELIGNSHRVVRHPDVTNEFYENMWNTLLNGNTWKGEIRNISKKGIEYWVYAIIKPVIKRGEVKGFTAIRTNITDKKQIEQLSITDELTNLYNRRFFNAKIEEEINRAKRENRELTLLILDVDYFKQYNDNYGHQNGDLALEKVAEVLKKRTNRASDFAFRLGGEEFAIITVLEKEKAITFAELIRRDIEDLKIEHKASLISKYITISIGLVSKNALDIVNSDKLYKEADDNLYEAKRHGRNTTFYDGLV